MIKKLLIILAVTMTAFMVTGCKPDRRKQLQPVFSDSLPSGAVTVYFVEVIPPQAMSIEFAARELKLMSPAP